MRMRKKEKNNQLSRLFFFAAVPSQPSSIHVHTKSLAEEHLYVELWLNFIIQTIYFNVGGGNGGGGAVIFSSLLIPPSLSLSIFVVFFLFVLLFFVFFFIILSIKVEKKKASLWFSPLSVQEKQSKREVNWVRWKSKKVPRNMVRCVRSIFLHFASQKHKCIHFVCAFVSRWFCSFSIWLFCFGYLSRNVSLLSSLLEIIFHFPFTMCKQNQQLFRCHISLWMFYSHIHNLQLIKK